MLGCAYTISLYGRIEISSLSPHSLHLLFCCVLLLLSLFTQTFSHERQLMVFHWSLSDSKSQVSRIFHSILAVLNNAIIWMVSTCPPTSKTSSSFDNPLVLVPKAPKTIGIIVTFMFHSFFQFPSKVEVLSLLFTFFQFYSVVSWDSKDDKFANSFFFFCWLLLGLVFWAKLGDPSVCQNPIEVYVCHFLG